MVCDRLLCGRTACRTARGASYVAVESMLAKLGGFEAKGGAARTCTDAMAQHHNMSRAHWGSSAFFIPYVRASMLCGQPPKLSFLAQSVVLVHYRCFLLWFVWIEVSSGVGMHNMYVDYERR